MAGIHFIIVLSPGNDSFEFNQFTSGVYSITLYTLKYLLILFFFLEILDLKHVTLVGFHDPFLTPFSVILQS